VLLIGCGRAAAFVGCWLTTPTSPLQTEKKEYVLSGQAKVEHDAALKLLCQGVNLLKYKNKKPKKRLIWVSERGDLVYWGEQDKVGQRITKGQIALKEVTSVVIGKSSQVAATHLISHICTLRRCGAGCLGSKSVNLSFTLVHPERTLDLEADSEPNRNKYMEAFKVLTRKPEQIAAINAAHEKALSAAASGAAPVSPKPVLSAATASVVGSKTVAAALASPTSAAGRSPVLKAPPSPLPAAQRSAALTCDNRSIDGLHG
jgi:hypothetical protein